MADEVTIHGGVADAAPADTGPLTVRSAVEALHKRDAKVEEIKERAPDGKFAPKESAPVEQDAAPLEATGEEPGIDPADVPPLELPRSWSKDRAEHWNKLDRDTQQLLLDHDSKASAEVRRTQNEAADIRKAAEAERVKAEQARQQYETAASNTLQALQAQQGQEFADIKTDADVQKLASDDPFRYLQWRARQDQIVGLHNQVQQAQEQKQQEQVKRFTEWSAEQDEKFVKAAPEFADPAKADDARKKIVKYLTEVRGVPQETLPELWSNPVFRDVRFQLVVRDAANWHAAQQKAVTAAKQPIPPVQRPGAATTKADANVSRIESLTKQLPSLKGMDATRTATELLRAQRAARR